jgi:hypothetical protein
VSTRGFYFGCCVISIILHAIVPKPEKWELPPIKEGRIDIARLDIHAKQVRPGKVEEFYNVPELFMRNVNMALLHVFQMMTEPYCYLRFCIMDSWGC